MKNPNGLSREDAECAQQELEDRWAKQLSAEGGAICKCATQYYRKRCIQCGRPFEPFRCLYCYDLGLVRTGNSGKQGETMPCPQCATERERESLRVQQSSRVMPTIGGLLDAWEALPNDITSEPELKDFARRLKVIEALMEGRHNEK